MECRLGVEDGNPSDSGRDNGEHEYATFALSDGSAENGDNVLLRSWSIAKELSCVKV